MEFINKKLQKEYNFFFIKVGNEVAVMKRRKLKEPEKMKLPKKEKEPIKLLILIKKRKGRKRVKRKCS